MWLQSLNSLTGRTSRGRPEDSTRQLRKRHSRRWIACCCVKLHIHVLYSQRSTKMSEHEQAAARCLTSQSINMHHDMSGSLQIHRNSNPSHKIDQTIIADRPVHRCCCVRLRNQVLYLQRSTKMFEPEQTAARCLTSQSIDRRHDMSGSLQIHRSE